MIGNKPVNGLDAHGGYMFGDGKAISFSLRAYHSHKPPINISNVKYPDPTSKFGVYPRTQVASLVRLVLG